MRTDLFCNPLPEIKFSSCYFCGWGGNLAHILPFICKCNVATWQPIHSKEDTVYQTRARVHFIEREREGGKQGWMEGEENRPVCGESLVEVLIGNRVFKLWTSVILKNYKRKELEISRVKSLWTSASCGWTVWAQFRQIIHTNCDTAPLPLFAHSTPSPGSPSWGPLQDWDEGSVVCCFFLIPFFCQKSDATGSYVERWEPGLVCEMDGAWFSAGIWW